MIAKLKDRFSKKKKKEELTPAQLQALKNAKSAQDWIPIYDVQDHIAYKKNQQMLCAIKIEPINIRLLSKNEQHAKIKALHEVINGIDFPIQIFTQARPVDLDGYIATLEAKKMDATPLQRRLLEGKIKIAANKAASGEALEREFYIIVFLPITKNLKENLVEKTREISLNLTSAGLTSHICDEQELRELNFIFTHPTEAAVERAPKDNYIIPSIFRGA